MSEDPTQGGGHREPHQPIPPQPNPYQAPSGPGYGHTAPFGAPPQPAPGPQGAPRSARGLLALGAVALALVSGGIGGAVGAWTTQQSTGGASVTNALDAPRPSTTTVAAAPAGSVQAVAQKVVPSVVRIEVVGRTAQGEGSGVILSSDGLILTKGSELRGAITARFLDGTLYDATQLSYDRDSDLALLKVNAVGLRPIKFDRPTDDMVGNWVAVCPPTA